MEPTNVVDIFREIINDSIQQLNNTIDPTTPTTVIPTISTKPTTRIHTTPTTTTPTATSTPLHYTIDPNTPTTVIPTISTKPTTMIPTTPATTTLTAPNTTIANNHIGTNNWSGRLKQQWNANLFNINNKVGKKGNKSFNHY